MHEQAISLLHAWNRCHGAFYQIQESDLRWNLERQTIMRYWADEIAQVPVLLAEPTPAGVAMGIVEKGIWISLYGEIRAGKEAEFSAAAEQFALSRDKKRLAFGSDEFHFLPGMPVDTEAGLRLAEAFKTRGFTPADCADFVGRPLNPKSAQYIAEARADASKRGWSLREVSSGEDHAELTAHLLREFKGRWSREWEFWQSRDDADRAFWNLLRDEKGNVLGFSRLARRGRVKDGLTPGAMRLSLSSGGGWSDTDSCLGPIGINKSERGRGAGKILLGLSLHELSLQGAELTCIDWTNAYNYYTPLGFEIVRKFHCLWKEL
ncbi:MAG: hypothetical protein ACXVC0_18880 [Bdellovibrionota bacterium]